jgi:hypothetical protein
MKMAQNLWKHLNMLAIFVLIIALVSITGCVTNEKPPAQVFVPPHLELRTSLTHISGENIEINITFQNSEENLSLNSTSYSLIITGPQGDVLAMNVLASSVGILKHLYGIKQI